MKRPFFVAGALGLLLFAADCGDPDQPTGAQNPSACPEPNLRDIQTKIFTPICATSTCHSTVQPQAHLSLASEQISCASLKGVASCEVPARKLVAPGNPTQSVLVQKLTCSAGDCTASLGTSMCASTYSNARMPFERPALSPCQVQAIQTWIAMGTPDCP